MSNPNAPRRSGASIDPSRIRLPRSFQIPTFANNVEAARYWAHFGYAVVPTVPGEKRSVCPWDSWLAKLSPQTIEQHWARHPDHEVGCILGEDYIVIDADSPAAEAEIAAIESRFGVQSRLIVQTKRGTHRHYQLAADTYARSDSHSTELHPGRLDVKTGRALVMLPPSGNRKIGLLQAAGATELSIVGQDFVDAVAVHNGRQPPRPIPATGESDGHGSHRQLPIDVLRKLLDYIDPSCGYDDWLRALLAIYHATGGSSEGLALADTWSSRGRNYKDSREVAAKWASFRQGHTNPVTQATLMAMAKEGGADVASILQPEDFTAAACTVVQRQPGEPPKASTRANPLTQYTLLGRLGEVEERRVAQAPLLGDIALLGQATVIYARPNTGKTLIILHLLIDAIKQGRVDPARIVYVNMDDNSSGLVEKLHLAEEFGFHMLADGYQGFDAKAFHDAQLKLIGSDSVDGIVLVLDTLKKFTNLMDKARSAGFASVIRQLVIKGGTVVALAHTNKHPDAGGRAVYSGTSDIVDDFDAAYVVQEVASRPDENVRVVEFHNIKRRGDNALSVAYAYALERSIPYHELLTTVREFDASSASALKEATAATAEETVIAAIAACIRDGINTKMQLATVAAERAGCTRRAAMRVVEKYTGTDPRTHRWRYVVRARGAKVFELLEPPNGGDTN